MRAHLRNTLLRARKTANRARLKAFSISMVLTVLWGTSGCGGRGLSSSAPSQPSLPTRNLIISAASDTVRAGETDIFRVEGSSTSNGVWGVSGSSASGKIDQNGLYTAPTSVPTPNTVSVTYTTDGQTYSHSIVILNPAPSLASVSPDEIKSVINTITAIGTNFVKGASLLINGQPVTTTYVDSNHLQATVAISSGYNSPINVAVSNPDPGLTVSSAIVVPVDVQPITASPSTVSGGTVNLSLSNIPYSSDLAATIDGRALVLSSSANSVVTASGFLPPWHTGTAQVRIFSKSTGSDVTTIPVQIAPTVVPFDTAARFLTQAGFGPRPDLIQHIQSVGLDAFITEQQATPAPPYDTTVALAGLDTILKRAVLGSNPLRMRVAWALQSYIVRSGIFIQVTNFPFEQKMEADSTGNYRDLMTDVASDASIAIMLNLSGNAVPNGIPDPNIHPNQNFARELLQLFTIGTVMLNDDGTVQTDGVGNPIPAYDQDTILNMSRVFTGWYFSPSINPAYTFYGLDWSAPLVAQENQHDQGQKTLFGNVVLPAGQTAEQDRKMALDAIFQHPNLPPFVSRILIQRLVKSNPSPEYVKRVVDVFKDDGKGVRGNLAAVVRTILLDPEARAGDTGETTPFDGFLQEPYLFETSVMNITGFTNGDGQSMYLPCQLTECIYYSPLVFGFYSPSYQIPGTTINSPEFQLLNDITIINRSQILWGILLGEQGGFNQISKSSWLLANSQSIPDLVDNLNHLAYHGRMSQDQQDFIINYCNQIQSNDPMLSIESAVFLALNADNFNVTQ